MYLYLLQFSFKYLLHRENPIEEKKLLTFSLNMPWWWFCGFIAENYRKNKKKIENLYFNTKLLISKLYFQQHVWKCEIIYLFIFTNYYYFFLQQLNYHFFIFFVTCSIFSFSIFFIYFARHTLWNCRDCCWTVRNFFA